MNVGAGVDVVVIGGSGFIGTRLCQELDRRGISFLLLDKRVSATYPDRTRVADVCSIEDLRRCMVPCRYVVNLAAEHRDDVRPIERYYEVNVVGAENVCSVASEFDVNVVVFTSSVACYGYAPPMTGEEGALNPFNEYGRTKMLAESVYRNWQAENDRRRSLLIVRPTVVFGERNRGNVFNLLNAIATKRFLMVGSGENVKSIAYVGNLVAFILFMLPKVDAQMTVNYVDEPQLEVRELVAFARRCLGQSEGVGITLPAWLGLAMGKVADVVSRISGRSLPVSEVRIRKFMATSSYSSAARSLGFEPPLSLEDALRKTIAFEFMGERTDELTFESE